ncbi:MAG: hypothetical protein JNM17_10525 [Archangium sp.]|nr:hypothetical protein [Archangium sp.]
MRVAIIFITALFFSACGAQTLCASSNCMGCCESPTGRCLKGDDKAFCGIAGSQCRVCTSTETCVRGGCESTNRPCSPSTCSGCCNGNGQCVSGQTQQECGNSGNACSVCLQIDMCVPTTGSAMGGLCQ